MAASSADKLRTAFTNITLVVVVVFGFITTLTIIEAPSKVLQPDFVENHKASSRLPASVGGNLESESRNSLRKMATLDAKCSGGDALKTGAERVRIRLKDCPKVTELDLRGSSFKNETNGQDASLFLQSEDISTEYISLNPGENTFSFTITPAGQKSLVVKMSVVRTTHP